MRELLSVMENITKGPKTSIVGFLMFLGGGLMIYEDWKNPETTLTYASIEVGVFFIGMYLFLSSDGIFFKNKKKDGKATDTDSSPSDS